MALLTEKWPAHTATCSKEHLEAKHGHIRDAVKRSSSQWPTGIKSPPYRMTPRGRRQYAAVFVWWEQWRVRLFLRAVCICYRVTFSRGPSAWHVTWWLKNQSNMNACGRGMKNDLTCSSWRLNELICLLLPFKNKKKNKMIHYGWYIPQKCCLERFYCESGSKADATDHLVSVDIWLTLSVFW